MRTFFRFFSILIYLFLALFFKIRLQNAKKIKDTKKILFTYLVIIVILSFFFHSYYEIDLNRLQERLINFSNMNFELFLKNVVTVTNYSEYTYFFLISRLNNPNYLQTITSLIFYSIIFYTMYDYYKTKELAPQSLGNTLFLFMLCGPFIGVISGIRTYLAISLVYLCVYREVFQNKKLLLNIPIYFIAIGMHNSILPIVIIRFCWLIVQKEKKFIYKIRNIIISLVLFYFFIKNGTEIINYTYNRANLYLDNNVYTNIYGYMVATINFLIMMFIFVNFKRSIKKDFDLYKYNKFMILIIITTFIFVYQYSIFSRYMGAIFIFYIPIFMFTFNLLQKSENTRYKHNFYFIYYILLLINIIVFYYFGDNSLINFFNMF